MSISPLSRRARRGQATRPDLESIATPLHKLGTRETQDEHARAAEADRQILEQIKQRLLGPVNVIEHRDDRTSLRQLFEQAADSHEDLVARALQLGLVAPGLKEDLADRREGHSFTVRRATADQGDGVVLSSADELTREPRLPDPWLPDDRHHARTVPGGNPAVVSMQPFELPHVSHKRRVRTTRNRRRLRIDRVEPVRGPSRPTSPSTSAGRPPTP